MTKKAKAIRGMGKEQMLDKMVELKKELLKMNSQIAVGTSPESPGRVKQIKKEIARILTIMNEPVQKAVKKPEAKATVASQGAAGKAVKRAEAGKTK